MAGTIKVADLAKVQDVEFVTRFAKNIERLQTILGITEPIAMQPGQNLKMYKTSGTLENGAVAEGADVPASKYTNDPVAVSEITIKKWRKETTLEAIAKRGYDQAVTKTDDEMMRDIQGSIFNDFFTVVNAGSGTTTGNTLQAVLANSRGELRRAFKNTTFTPVHFVSTDDISEYLGTHDITVQTAFGMTYLENFLNLGMVIEDPCLDMGVTYGTAIENLNLYYCDPSSVDGFNFMTDETGLVGIYHEPAYKNETYQTHAVSGLTFFPEYADCIVKGTITPGP